MATELITVGAKAPDFSLVADDGTTISLSDYQDTKNVILYFMREFN